MQNNRLKKIVKTSLHLRILNTMTKTSHFKALIHLKTTKEGGLVSPISTGFRSLFQFPFDLKTYIGVYTFEEDELIFPGDSVSIDITLLNAEEFLEKLFTGMDFELSDNSGAIGNGVVTVVYP